MHNELSTFIWINSSLALISTSQALLSQIPKEIFKLLKLNPVGAKDDFLIFIQRKKNSFRITFSINHFLFEVSCLRCLWCNECFLLVCFAPPASGGGRQYQRLDQSEAGSTGNQPIRTLPDVSHIYVVTSCVIFDTWNKSHSMANNSQYFLSCWGTRILIHIMAMIKQKHLQCDEERVFWLNLGVPVIRQSCLTNKLPGRQRRRGDWSCVIPWSSWTLSQRCHVDPTRPSLLSHSPWLCLLVTAGEIHWKWNTSLIRVASQSQDQTKCPSLSILNLDLNSIKFSQELCNLHNSRV